MTNALVREQQTVIFKLHAPTIQKMSSVMGLDKIVEVLAMDIVADISNVIFLIVLGLLISLVAVSGVFILLSQFNVISPETQIRVYQFLLKLLG